MLRSRRFGGNIFCQLPLGLSCMDGFLSNGHTEFIVRRARMQAVISAVTAALQAPELVSAGCGTALISFVPPVPVVSLVHAVFRAPLQAVAMARDAVATETGALFPYPYCYCCEWSACLASGKAPLYSMILMLIVFVIDRGYGCGCWSSCRYCLFC